jgi:hypothetical protein
MPRRSQKQGAKRAASRDVEEDMDRSVKKTLMLRDIQELVMAVKMLGDPPLFKEIGPKAAHTFKLEFEYYERKRRAIAPKIPVTSMSLCMSREVQEWLEKKHQRYVRNKMIEYNSNEDVSDDDDVADSVFSGVIAIRWIKKDNLKWAALIDKLAEQHITIMKSAYVDTKHMLQKVRRAMRKVNARANCTVLGLVDSYEAEVRQSLEGLWKAELTEAQRNKLRNVFQDEAAEGTLQVVAARIKSIDEDELPSTLEDFFELVAGKVEHLVAADVLFNSLDLIKYLKRPHERRAVTGNNSN